MRPVLIGYLPIGVWGACHIIPSHTRANIMKYFLTKALPCLVLGVFLLIACEKHEEASMNKTADSQQAKTTAEAPAPPEPVVVVINTEMRTIQPGFEYPATIEAVETAAMRPQVAGVVKRRNITPGSLVNEGDLLMVIDDADYRMKVEEIKAAIAQTEANAAEAEANFKRAEKLKDKGYISLKDYDTAQARYLSAGAMRQQMAAKLQRAELDLKRTRIYAPFSGRISKAHYAVGDYVSPTSPQPLFELAKTDPVYAVGKVPMAIYEEFVFKAPFEDRAPE